MPFDPTKPANNSPNSSAEMRSQFNGLKALIDSIATVSAAQVDGVTTLPPSEPATVDLAVTGGTLHFTFGIPQGYTGAEGPQGPPGEVTQTDLNNAVQGMLGQSSNNSNAVSMLSQVADPDYNQAQMQSLFSKVDELINALRR